MHFFSTLYILSYNIELIKNVFLTKELSPYGIYYLRLCNNGEPTDIIVDDYIPYDSTLNTECFTKSNSHSLWVHILEKAFAKMLGSYFKLENIDFDTIIESLTFSQVININSRANEVSNLLLEAYNNNWLILAGAGDTQGSKELLKDIALLPSFFYPIKQVYFIKQDINNRKNSFDNEITLTDTILKIENKLSRHKWYVIILMF